MNIYGLISFPFQNRVVFAAQVALCYVVLIQGMQEVAEDGTRSEHQNQLPPCPNPTQLLELERGCKPGVWMELTWECNQLRWLLARDRNLYISLLLPYINRANNNFLEDFLIVGLFQLGWQRDKLDIWEFGCW